MRHLRLAAAVAAALLLAPAAAVAATSSLSFTAAGGGVYVVAASGATPPGQLGIGSGVLATFSPNGSKVAYFSGGQLMVANGNGSAARRLAGGISVGAGLPGGGPPSWSPNGKTIAYSDGQALWTVSAAGGKPKSVSGSTNGFIDGATHPVWSHSGKTLYYLAIDQVASVESTDFGVFSVPVTGGKSPTSVNAGFAIGWNLKPFSLDISPSGRTLAVTLADDGQFAVGLVPVTGGMGTVLSNLSAAAFSPSGTQLCAQSAGGIVVTSLGGVLSSVATTTAGATACSWVTG
jgi:hypothetical protein